MIAGRIPTTEEGRMVDVFMATYAGAGFKPGPTLFRLAPAGQTNGSILASLNR